MLIVQQMNDTRGPLASGHHVRTRAQELEKTQRGTLLHRVERVARHQQFGYVVRERVGHVSIANVGNALKRECDENGIARCQIVLDALDDQTHQITLVVQYDRDEQVAL